MRAAPVPRGKVRLLPRTAAIQPSTAHPTRRLLDRRMGSPSSKHTAWLGRYQDWQWDAKRYARTVGVVRFAANLVASTAGRCTLIIEQRDERGDWVETEDPALQQLLALYGNETFGQTANELVRLHTWHYQVAGEAVICNRDDNQGVAEWLIASMDAVEWDKPQKDLATIRFHPGGVVSDGTAVILPRDQMLRYWMPDEEWLGLATSPLTAVMDDIRRYKSLVRYAQRQAESYLAMNGILWTPEKPHASPASGDVTEHEGDDPLSPAEQQDRIFDLYNEWANMSINDDDSIAAVLPPMMWFGEQGDEPKHIDIAGPLDQYGPAHREEALQDIGRGVDSPMSLVAAGGANEENHWGAWITQERFIAAVAPTLDRVTHQDMTVAFLYPLMRLMGRQDMRRTRIGYDATPVIVHPDKSDKALRGLLAGVVGFQSTREAMGFDESDAPTPEDIELLKQILTSFGAGQAPPGGGGGMPGMPTPPGPAPAEKVGPATVEEKPPDEPRGLGLAASVLGPYLPRALPAAPANGGNGHTRTAASLNGGMNGVMLALPVAEQAGMYALPDGEDPDDYHMTLLYFGKADEIDPTMHAALRGIASAVTANSDMPYIDLSHVERFAPTPDGHSGDLYPCCLVDGGPDVPALVQQLKAACDAAGVPYHNDHAFRSHVTLGYYPEGEGLDSGPLPEPVAYSPDALMLHWGDEVDAYPFVDAPEPGAQPPATVLASSLALTAARRAYTFDESAVERDEGGRFTFKDGGASKKDDEESEDEREGARSEPDSGESQAWDSLPDDQQDAILEQAAKHRLDYDDMNARADALLDYAQREGSEQMAKGMGWYSRMRDLADERAAKSGLTREEYIGLVAATSPRMQWDWENYPDDDPRKYPNLNAADLMAKLWNQNPDLTVTQWSVDRALTTEDGRRAYAPRDLSEFLGETRPLREWDPDIAARLLTSGERLQEPSTAAHVMWPRAADALRVMHESAAGGTPGDVLGGPKTYAFNNTLLDPGYRGTVVDAWMIQALSGRTGESSGGANAPPGSIDVHVLDQPNTTPGPKTQYKEDWEPRGTVYTLMSAAVEEAAADRGMSPSDAQAVIWYVLRDTGFDNMPPELMEVPAAPVDRSM